MYTGRRRSIRRGVALKTASLVAAFVFFPGLVSSSQVSLNLSSVQPEYVVKEPVKLIVQLINDSESPINIPEVRYFDMNMRFFLLEVTTPSGEVQIRKFQYAHEIAIVNTNYGGELLDPGNKIETYLYPNVSFFVNHPRQQSSEVGTGITFPDPGEYRLRVIYTVSPDMKNLWKGVDGELYSNTIDIEFREPDASEKEILDALWSEGGGALSVENALSKYDEPVLRRVITKYPDNSLTRYAEFALAKSLLAIRQNTTLVRMEDGIGLLERLMELYPDFRGPEVRQHLATSYHRTQRREEASRLFQETLERYPALKDNYHFMQKKIIADTESIEAIAAWRKERRKGVGEPNIREE